MPPLIVVCADIGSVIKGNFGWMASTGVSGALPSSLAEYVAGLLNNGTRVALGFECPLFVPISGNERLLTKARVGEGSRPWSAGAGCGALATGIVEVTWVLERIQQMIKTPIPSFLDWYEFERSGSGLFIWEAFVTGGAKKLTHVADADSAVRAFVAALPNITGANSISSECAVHSLVGAAMLRTGWSTDISILGKSCLVIRA